MKKLIVNADDFGRTLEINRGVLEAFQQGIVTSASLMVTFTAFKNACDLIHQHDLETGLHFNLTEGKPVSPAHQIESLVDRDGNFFHIRKFAVRLYAAKIQKKHVEQELKAQLEKCENHKIAVTHFDSHHHIHVFPQLAEIIQPILHKRGIFKIRNLTKIQTGIRSPYILAQKKLLSHMAGKYQSWMPHPVIFSGLEFMASRDKKKCLWKMINNVQGSTEIMCHPGYRSAENIGKYNAQRADELRALCDPEVRILIKNLNLQLSSFQGI